MSSIVVKNISKELGKHKILSEISLDITGPEIVGIEGINGSGKTMLLRVIAGLMLPNDGTVFIDGKQLGKDISFPPSMGILIENPAFLGMYSAKKNLRLLSSLGQGIDEAEIEHLLQRVGLETAGNKKYRKFSLGMKQRLGIAAALLGKPDIIILDEPTNALDASGVSMLQQIIREEKQRGAIVLLSCHDTEFLRSVSDVIFFISDGKITGSETFDHD